MVGPGQILVTQEAALHLDGTDVIKKEDRAGESEHMLKENHMLMSAVSGLLFSFTSWRESVSLFYFDY